MFEGTVVFINIAAIKAGPMVSLEKARAVADLGLEGDRYFKGIGTYSHIPGPEKQITLIEEETIAALARERGLEIHPRDARRNIVTRGVPLNHLVGETFRVGEAVLRGVVLCEPCSHLQRLTDKRILTGLLHRGGLSAEIVSSGIIRVGDRVFRPTEQESGSEPFAHHLNADVVTSPED